MAKITTRDTDRLWLEISARLSDEMQPIFQRLMAERGDDQAMLAKLERQLVELLRQVTALKCEPKLSREA